MNSGCYGDEISNILISIKAIDFNCNILEIKRDQIKFYYRGTNLPKDLIILSAKLHANNGDKSLINEKIKRYMENKKKILNQVRLRHAGALLKTQKTKRLGN